MSRRPDTLAGAAAPTRTTVASPSAAALLGGLVLLALASLVVALASGSVSMTAAELLSALRGTGSELHQSILWELRAPRAAAAFVVGGMLALAGVHMQVLLRNPLADPYILGVSGGAAVAALAAILAGVGAGTVSAAAAAGALASMVLVFALARGRGAWSTTRLLLTGVVVAAGWGALISLLLAISPDASLRAMLFWLMGDLGHGGPTPGGIVVLAGALAVSLALARQLDLLAYGELQASALGVAVGPLRLVLYVTGSLATAAAVTIAGSIGFVGLVVPHALRLLGAGDHRRLVPAAVLLGGTLLVCADTLARTLLSPQQLPVGVVTAFVGVPVFLVLLHRGARPFSS